MRTKIYYFSATGNCLAAAKQIAQSIGADMESIAKANRMEHVHLEHERIGIVFPAYLTPVMGVPRIVERFLQKIDNLEAARIFAVCTCGGYEFANAYAPLVKLRKRIQACGGKLSAEYSVRMPMSNLDYAHIPVPISSDIPKIILRAKQKVDKIAKRIQRNKGTQYPLAKMVAFGFVQMIYRLFRDKAMAVLREKALMPEGELLQAADYLPQTDRSILIRDSCVGCGICAKVCPAQNIQMENGRPVFQHRCEMCFACDEWCPVGAIQHWSREAGIKYHYPDTQWPDLL